MAVHGGDCGFGVGGPFTHGVWVCFRVVLDGLGGAAVGIALTQDGVHGAAHEFGVADFDFLLGIRGGVFREIGEGVAF